MTGTHLVNARTMFLWGSQAFHGNVHAVKASSEDVGKAARFNSIAIITDVYIMDKEGGWEGCVSRTESEEEIDHAAAKLMVRVGQIQELYMEAQGRIRRKMINKRTC
jgi:hypothetical protein